MVIINRQAIPRLTVFKDPNDAIVYQDPFSLSPIHGAWIIPTKKKKITFSAACYDAFKNLSANELISQIALATSAQLSVPYLGIEFDHKISDVMVQVPFLYGGIIINKQYRIHLSNIKFHFRFYFALTRFLE